MVLLNILVAFQVVGAKVMTIIYAMGFGLLILLYALTFLYLVRKNG